MYTLYSIVVIFSSYYNSLAVQTVFSAQINMKIPEKKTIKNIQTFKLTFFLMYTKYLELERTFMKRTHGKMYIRKQLKH